MKKSNNLTLAILATLVGATFAYFASSIDEGPGSNLTTFVDENDVFFTAVGANMTMDVTADKMTQHASLNGVIEAAGLRIDY